MSGLVAWVGVAAWVAWPASRALQVTLGAKPAAVDDLPPAPPLPVRPLSIRLVDAGGVGIAPDSVDWGHDYSHDSRALHQLVTGVPPYVDDRAFAGVRRDWDAYVGRMAAYGNTGVVLDAFLEVLTFDALPGVAPVYPADSPLRARPLALRARLGELVGSARRAGLDVFFKTDMIPLTAPLKRHLRALPGGLRGTNPAVWHVMAAGVAELFDALPDLAGLVVRIGEAGPLYTEPGWDYWSELLVTDSASLTLMLRTLLPVFERRGKLLVLRSWTVGVGALGDLHTDPRTYAAVLDPIESPNLIVSTKFTAGDFFSYLPPNPTLLHGRQRRLVEFQARREFEGFGAFPDFVGPAHQAALATFLAANPRIAGSYLWTQAGGPLRAGPMSLYPLHGQWDWIDANVYATSALARDPAADLDTVMRGWAAARFGADPRVTAAVGEVLRRSREAVRAGLYIAPFAERAAHLGSLPLPPLLWIHEWDVVGGWSAVLSTVYRGAGDDWTRARDDGFAAVRTVRGMAARLAAAAPAVERNAATYHALQRSLAYQESLLEALAWYRAAFLHHYRWLQAGARADRRAWIACARRFERARAAHVAAWAGDLDLPAYDFSAADHAVSLMRRSGTTRWTARIGLGLLLALIGLGARAARRPGQAVLARVAGACWTGATRPWRLDGTPSTPAGAIALAIALPVALTVAAFSSFTVWPLVAGVVALLAVVAVAFKLAWNGPRPAQTDGAVTAALAPALAAALPLLAVMAVRGPLYFWYRFWTDLSFRWTCLTVALFLAGWVLFTAYAAGRSLTRRSIPAVVGTVLVAAGATLVFSALVLPEVPRLLMALDSPLAVLPMRTSVITGIFTYYHLPAALPAAVLAAGLALGVAGWGLQQTRDSRFKTQDSSGEALSLES